MFNTFILEFTNISITLLSKHIDQFDTFFGFGTFYIMDSKWETSKSELHKILFTIWIKPL
jgi:hypothetical protein